MKQVLCSFLVLGAAVAFADKQATQQWVSNQVQNAVHDINEKLDTEQSARISGDAVIQTNLNNEVTARTNADSALDQRIKSLEEDHTNDVKEIKKTLSALAQQHTNEVSEIRTDVANLQTNLENEVSNRVEAVSNVQSNLEESVSNLVDRIDQERSARESADLELDGKIQDESESRQAKDTMINQLIEVERDTREDQGKVLTRDLAQSQTNLYKVIKQDRKARVDSDNQLRRDINDNLDTLNSKIDASVRNEKAARARAVARGVEDANNYTDQRIVESSTKRTWKVSGKRVGVVADDAIQIDPIEELVVDNQSLKPNNKKIVLDQFGVRKMTWTDTGVEADGCVCVGTNGLWLSRTDEIWFRPFGGSWDYFDVLGGHLRTVAGRYVVTDDMWSDFSGESGNIPETFNAFIGLDLAISAGDGLYSKSSQLHSSSGPIRSVIFNKGKYVFGVDGVGLYTSTNGVEWIQSFSGDYCYNVALIDENRIIATATRGTCKVLQSRSGANWEQQIEIPSVSADEQVHPLKFGTEAVVCDTRTAYFCKDSVWSKVEMEGVLHEEYGRVSYCPELKRFFALGSNGHVYESVGIDQICYLRFNGSKVSVYTKNADGSESRIGTLTVE